MSVMTTQRSGFDLAVKTPVHFRHMSQTVCVAMLRIINPKETAALNRNVSSAEY